MPIRRFGPRGVFSQVTAWYPWWQFWKRWFWWPGRP
jgi:hypothetical protein